MKIVFSLFLIILTFFVKAQQTSLPNIFIITTDGFRWQEVFNGADSAILHNPKYVTDTAIAKELFWATDVTERRKLLMPFIWKTIVSKGSIYGNRNLGSNVSVANPYRFSYAGYNEMFTGYADPSIIANKKKWNTNENILDFLNNQPAYKNKVAAFTSWNLFEYILNKKHSSIYLNSGYQPIATDSLTKNELLINGIQQNAVDNTQPTRNDMLTFVTAKEYIQTNHPKVVYVGFGQTDEFAHGGHYDDYLQSAHLFDEYIAQLWYLVNNDPFYKNNTSFIITTDHGRGQKTNTWVRHDMFTKGSKNTWLITLGKSFAAKGEVQNEEELFTEQIAQTIAQLLGFQFIAQHTTESAFSTNIIKRAK
jgi:Metalloenzyme superfamily